MAVLCLAGSISLQSGSSSPAIWRSRRGTGPNQLSADVGIGHSVTEIMRFVTDVGTMMGTWPSLSRVTVKQ